MKSSVNSKAPRARAWLLALSLLSGCAGTAPTREPAGKREVASAHPVVAAAQALLGAPYRYGGVSPEGFDCSGFVRYVYQQVGVPVPRSTSEQLKKARPVTLTELRPGDLVFFRISRRKVSHVGIYVESGRFIHAPSRGKRVSYASIEDEYWNTRLVAAGRFL